MENMEQKRESWGSRFGFIMATAGFAVGLGNIWRFPYMAGVNGGGAFVLVYLAICAVIGIPLFIAEISLGRKTQLNPVAGMRKLTRKGGFWVLIGWTGTVASVVLMSYYLIVIGRTISYFFRIILGQFNDATTESIQSTYQTFVANPMQSLLFTLIAVVILGVIVSRGLKNGIEKVAKALMPALLVMLVILAIRSLTLPGAFEGLKWYLTPDFSKINGEVALAALGQAFFSIGIGIACAFTYGSYLHPTETDVPKDAVIVIILDTAIALIAGLVIFPAIFSFGMSPEAGSGLLFVSMPKLFAELPAGNLFGGMFFFLVVIAGLTSGMGYLETVAATTAELAKISRKKATWCILALMFVLGIPSVLSQGLWAHIKIFGRTFFDFADYISGNVLMAVCALLVALYTGYVWKFENYMNDANIGAKGFRVAKWWKPIVVVFIPIALIIIMITGIF